MLGRLCRFADARDRGGQATESGRERGDSAMSEQPRPKMRYPKGRIVLVRDSTVAICLNNNPGAVLLSTLLFWYDNPHKFDTYQGDDFTLCRTQAAISEQACRQIDVKTIHDTAVPLLQLLGYLSV